MPLRNSLLHFLAEQSRETVWAIDTDCLNAWSVEAAGAAVAAAAQAAQAAEQAQGGGIAIIPLAGPLMPRALTFMGRVLLPGMDSFRASVARAAADPQVGAIVIDVNSPGGTVAGTPETAAALKAAAAVKPVVAMVDTLCASAAYWIASQANEMVVTPSGEVGSIGIIAVHLDLSQALENEGVKATVFRSRPGKGDRSPYEPLTDEAKAAIQASVDDADAEFIKAVAQGRKTTPAAVRGGFGEGRLVSAKQAVSLGMVDRSATMAEVLNGMVKPRAAARPRRSAFVFD